MFNSKEIEFMRIYVSLMYKKGYCYFDLSKEYLENYLNELKKVIENKNEFKEYNNLENIFIFDELMGNYSNFINLILYVTHNPKYSFYNEKANIVMLKFDDDILDETLSSIKLMNINVINSIVDYMINYINNNIKIKVITK